MEETTDKLSVPDKIMFTQHIRKTTNFVFYELHLLGRIVFYYSGKTLKECQKARDIWLEEQKS